MKRRLIVGVIVSIVVALAACSRDGRPESTTPSTTAPTTTSSTAPLTPTTPVTEPPATDTAAVTPILQSLVDRYDTAVAAILADPRVASNSEHEAVAAYLRLFTPGNDFSKTALQFWADEGKQGHFYRPGTLGQMYKSTVQSIQADSPEQVTFAVCSLKSILIVDEAGAEISAEGGQSAGSIVAVRVDGTWLLRDLSRTPPTNCPDPRDEP